MLLDRRFFCVCVVLLLAAVSLPAQQAGNAADAYKQGHSHQGGEFDTGPRQKPWRMSGIGTAHFPITTGNPEVQQWFDQGNALLHSFWFYEAERSFRWCLTLEPGNAMAYWGLARASEGERAHDFIREAVKREKGVSERERLFIEAVARDLLPDPALEKPEPERQHREALKVLETLCLKYPDDLEARSLLALWTMYDSRYGAELMIREVLAKQPDHPGAHHYRIHNWDYHEPEQALASSRRYSELVPGIGHALHMPGHIYSIVGMWHEAAISMDAATRAEKKYMQETLTFPFNQWNYGHNRHYLSYIQEQLGMADAALAGARELLDGPQDPKDNGDLPRTAHSYGLQSLTRGLLKFERWEEVLDGKTIPWRDLYRDKADRAYAESRAWLGKGELEKAEKRLADHTALASELDKNKDFETVYRLQSLELRARVALQRGDTIRGLGMMADAAQREFDLQRQYADPPIYPQLVYTTLGDAYLAAKSPLLAKQAYQKALTLTRNDIFALSGMVRACAALNEQDEARRYLEPLLYTAAGADRGLKVVELAKAAGLQAEARDNSPAPQRRYDRTPLEQYGPSRWHPYAAPTLEARDIDGKPVTLADYKGKNVLLVFYLGAECPHCMQQLHSIGAKKDEWDKLNTVVLAVSSATPEKNRAGRKAFGDLPIRLLSDSHFANAQRFHSYDDFESMELHSTMLIDSQGRLYWARLGGAPFSDMTYLVKQVERMNELTAAR